MFSFSDSESELVLLGSGSLIAFQKTCIKTREVQAQKVQKSNSVTQTVESLEKTHYRICFSDLITWVTTPSQSKTSNDILLRPDIKTINQPSCLIEEPKPARADTRSNRPISGVYSPSRSIELTTHERSNFITAIKSTLYIQIKITNPQKPRNHSRGRRTQSPKSNC